MNQPNVLLICTDQHRFDVLGAYGNPHISTPNLDRLAEQGVVFENCYVQNTVCAPSRASLMTGRYVTSHGLHANGVDLAPHEQLFTRLLADAGYDCGLVGKLHLGACHGGRSEPRLDDGLRVFRWAHAPNPAGGSLMRPSTFCNRHARRTSRSVSLPTSSIHIMDLAPRRNIAGSTTTLTSHRR